MSTDALVRAYSSTGAAWQRGPGRIYDRLAETLVAASPVPLAGRLVLDLGAGTGAATRAIRAAGGSSIAADVALGMLRAMRPEQVARAVADARALPVADGTLDGVVAAFSLNHVPDPERALREALRVTKPGSPLLVSSYASDDTHPVKQAVDQAATELGWRSEGWVHDLRTVSIPVLASVEGARRVALEAGLDRVEVRYAQVPFPELTAQDLVAWRCGMAQLAPFVADLDASERRRLGARSVELLGAAPVLVRSLVLLTAVR